MAKKATSPTAKPKKIASKRYKGREVGKLVPKESTPLTYKSLRDASALAGRDLETAVRYGRYDDDDYRLWQRLKRVQTRDSTGKPRVTFLMVVGDKRVYQSQERHPRWLDLVLNNPRRFLPPLMRFDPIKALSEPEIANLLARLFFVAHNGKGRHAAQANQLLRELLPQRKGGGSPNLKQGFVREFFRRELMRVRFSLGPKTQRFIKNRLRMPLQHNTSEQVQFATIAVNAHIYNNQRYKRIKQRAKSRLSDAEWHALGGRLGSQFLDVTTYDVEQVKYGMPRPRTYAVRCTAMRFGISPRQVQKIVRTVPDDAFAALRER